MSERRRRIWEVGKELGSHRFEFRVVRETERQRERKSRNQFYLWDSDINMTFICHKAFAAATI